MKNKLKFKYPHKTGEIVIPNFVSSGEKYIHELASEIKCGGYACYTKSNEQELKQLKKIKRSRYRKKEKVDEAYIDRVLAGVMPGPLENG